MQFGSIKTEKGGFLIEIESDMINCVNVCEEDMYTYLSTCSSSSTSSSTNQAEQAAEKCSSRSNKTRQ